MSVVCLLVAAGLYLLIRRTRLGAQIRAGASNRDMVQILGINIDWVYRLVFALGVSLAAFAGMINAPVTAVAPGMGMQMLIVSFVVVIVGGAGHVVELIIQRRRAAEACAPVRYHCRADRGADCQWRAQAGLQPAVGA